MRTSKEDSRKHIIEQLQNLAKDVLLLKETHRQKRPIVIEFSGSPKSGKTSCINSLELFLKRNGFKVEIIQERASVCPVADKQSPMFNLWTSCTSIAGLIGELEKKAPLCDVLILDRGIFDSCCWFEWLNKRKMMETDCKDIIEDFVLMEQFAKKIDIVFVFEAEPIVSIQREYANLLTDKPGSIMNQKVLQEYLDAIKHTVVNKGNKFQKIVEIDTTNKDQDKVGKEVTTNTLEILREALMEKISYCAISQAKRNILHSKQVFKFEEVKDYFTNIKFDLRENVEANRELLQPIPIAVITNSEKSKLLLVKKTPKATSNNSPEKGKSLVYVGGHSRIEDRTNRDDFLSLCKCTLKREVKEEIGISVSLEDIEPFIIYTHDNETSKQHIAICFVIELDIDAVKLRLDAEELILTKGKSKSGKFYNISEIVREEIDNMEEWSKRILQYYFKQEIPVSMTLLDYYL